MHIHICTFFSTSFHIESHRIVRWIGACVRVCVCVRCTVAAYARVCWRFTVVYRIHVRRQYGVYECGSVSVWMFDFQLRRFDSFCYIHQLLCHSVDDAVRNFCDAIDNIFNSAQIYGYSSLALDAKCILQLRNSYENWWGNNEEEKKSDEQNTKIVFESTMASTTNR